METEPFYIFQKKEVLQLQAPQLYFLLDDLAKKLEHSLSSSAKMSFLKVQTVILVLLMKKISDGQKKTINREPAYLHNISVIKRYYFNTFFSYFTI